MVNGKHSTFISFNPSLSLAEPREDHITHCRSSKTIDTHKADTMVASVEQQPERVINEHKPVLTKSQSLRLKMQNLEQKAKRLSSSSHHSSSHSKTELPLDEASRNKEVFHLEKQNSLRENMRCLEQKRQSSQRDLDASNATHLTCDEESVDLLKEENEEPEDEEIIHNEPQIPDFPRMNSRRALLVNATVEGQQLQETISSLDKKNEFAPPPTTLEELDAAIEVTKAELKCLQVDGKERQQERARELELYNQNKAKKEECLIALARIAKSFIGFWEYADIVEEEFSKGDDPRSHFWWCVVEAWILRVIHHNMMFKHQLDIVKKDCNEMIRDMLGTVPRVQNEHSLKEVCALSDLCKVHKSKRTRQENLDHYLKLQRRMICKLKKKHLETASQHRQAQTQQDMTKRRSGGSIPEVPNSFEQALSLSQINVSNHSASSFASCDTSVTSIESSSSTQRSVRSLTKTPTRSAVNQKSSTLARRPRRANKSTANDDQSVSSSRSARSTIRPKPTTSSRRALSPRRQASKKTTTADDDKSVASARSARSVTSPITSPRTSRVYKRLLASAPINIDDDKSVSSAPVARSTSRSTVASSKRTSRRRPAKGTTAGAEHSNISK